MGKETTYLPSQLCILPHPAVRGSGLLLAHPTPQGRRGLHLPTLPLSPRGLGQILQGPSPLWAASQRWDRRDACTSHKLHPLLSPTRDPARLPSLVFSAPHLLCRHRPFPRAAAAALAGTTAALRHLRRLLGFRRAQLRPAVRHIRPGSYRPLAPESLLPGRSSVRILRMVLAVSSCRTYFLSRRPQ